MAIVSVQMPQKENSDPLNNLLKTMQIIQAGFGIKTDIEQNKLLDTKNEQERINLRNLQSKRERDYEGIFSQIDYENANKYDPVTGKLANAETPGAQPGYIRVAKTDADGNPVFDKNGNKVIVKELFHHIPPSYAEGSIQNEKKALADLNAKVFIARQHGQFTSSDLLDPKVIADYSLEEKKGYRQGNVDIGNGPRKFWYKIPLDYDIATNALKYGLESEKFKQDKKEFDANKAIREKQLEISTSQAEIAKDRLKAEKEKTKNVLFNLSPADHKGYKSAKEAGIENPTTDDITTHNPDRITKDVNDISDRVQKAKIPGPLEALVSIDKMIPGGLDSDNPIPGAGKVSWWVGAAPFGLGEKGLTESQSKLKTKIDALRNQLLSMRSGQAVNIHEAERLANELGTALFSSERALRNGLKNVRDYLKSELSNIEAGYRAPSLNQWFKQPKSYHTNLPVFRESGDNRSTIIAPTPNGKALPSQSKPFVPKEKQSDESAADQILNGR